MENKPSATAQIVALNLAITSRRPGFGNLVASETLAMTEAILASTPRSRFWLRISKLPGFLSIFDRFESWTVPGMATHQVLRKLCLEEEIVRSLESGFKQFVVLGGGFDTLTARLARRFPSCSFLEADHPATQAVKKRALESAGYLSPNLALVPVDFNKTEVKEALLGLPAFRPEAPTVVLCEGVLMYLNPEAVDRLFAGLASLPCPSLRFAFTFMEAEPGGPVAFHNSSPLVSAWLRWRKEVFTWGTTRKDMGAFLSKRAFVLEEVVDHADLRKRYVDGLEGVRIAEGEKIAFAMRR